MITVADDGRQMDRPEMSAQQVGYVMFQVKVIGIIGKITCGVEVQNGRFVPVFTGKLSRQLATFYRCLQNMSIICIGIVDFHLIRLWWTDLLDFSDVVGYAVTGGQGFQGTKNRPWHFGPVTGPPQLIMQHQSSSSPDFKLTRLYCIPSVPVL